jgi:DNA-binding NarL/FixJ family response regulator
MADPALLDEVRQAADAALEALAAGEDTADVDGRKRAAARAALDDGHPIAAIAAAEAEGERAARERVGAQVLRAVERTAKKMRDSTEEHEQTVAQAVRLGLPARDIGARAGVSHGTVTAVARRYEQAQAAPPQAAAPATSEVVDAGESAPGSGAD